MSSSVKVDLGISKYCKSYEFKTDWLHQRPNSGFFHSLQLSDQEYEEDMKDEIDNVMGLLDKMKEERQEEMLSSQSERVSRLERLKRSRHPHEQSTGEKGTKYSTEDEDLHREGQQKRKQDYVVAELREKAEIISKSARKGPQDVTSTLSRNQNMEDDPEASKYLEKIRDTSTSKETREKKEQLETNTVVVDLPPQTPRHKTSVTVKLNLDMQKSKIAVAKGSGLQGRRKPTTEHIRRSLLLSDEEEPEDASAKFDADLEEGMDADDEDEPATPNEITRVEADFSESMGTAEAKVMPQSHLEYGERMVLERRGSFDGLIPRSTPKPRKPAWKSKTYGGVALPAFAEAMKAGSKSLKKTDTAEKLLTADVVKQAAINKLNRAAKEDIPEKEPEKPAWLVEAEARRKLHDKRRNAGDREKIKPSEPDERVIPIRLKKTGSKLLEEDIDKIAQLQEDNEDDSQTNKFVFKLKPTVGRGEKQSFESEPTKISFQLKPTGIQLVEPEQPKQEAESTEAPVTATFVKDFETEPPVSSIRLRHISKPEPVVHRLEEHEERVTPSVRLRHIAPKHEPEPRVEEQEKPSPSFRLRHITPKPEPESRVDQQERATVRLGRIAPKPIVKDFESTQEPELTMKLRLRGKAPPIYPDEEDTNVQISRVIPSSKPSQSQDESAVRKAQTLTTYVTPKPVKVVATNEYREPKALEIAQLIDQQPLRTTPESTSSLPQTRSTPKNFYKVTPIGSEPTRRLSYGSSPRLYEVPSVPTYSQPLSPTSSKTFSPPMSPTLKATLVESTPSNGSSRTFSPPPKATVVSHQRVEPTPIFSGSSRRFSSPVSTTPKADVVSYRVEPTPTFSGSTRAFSPQMSTTPKATLVSHRVEPTPTSSGRSMLPAKSNRGRRISAERSKTVVVSGSEVQRIIPGRRMSYDDATRHPVRRSSSLEYPRSHVEKAANAHLKHAVTVVKASSLPQKARTMLATEQTYSPRYTTSVESFPTAKQDLFDRRKLSSSISEQDFFVRPRGSISNKENEPRIVTQMEPRWMRELPDRTFADYDSSYGDIQADRMEAIERLEKRSSKTSFDSDDEVREIPNFIKEFERKRRMKTRGFRLIQQSYPPNDQSYA
ncbi:proteoglycan 4 isoform X2 [Exaiptasia diaphana]|uniref:Uncharacterized protein n=1 Tax=Exaiptasia diaphana TaxID=2652724 RepID=A0A913Y5J2_EXADI|nr:proteoglycan 4 isoform X2 [Exaiptasia diaphana]